jgi:ribosomal protein S18 acetylase RimI-like enzyme
LQVPHQVGSGASHAFILDIAVDRRHQHLGVGTELVALAADEARAAGCEWLHVDFEDHLRPFLLRLLGLQADRRRDAQPEDR